MTKYVQPIDASEKVLADGSVPTPGEPFDLDKEALKDEHNKRLIEEGQLLEVKDAPQHQAKG